MDDEKIVELFFARSEQAISALDDKYGKLCYKIAYNILNNDLDVEECINDTYLAVWNAIPPQRPNPLSAFVCKLVRNHSISRHRANTATKRNSAYDITLCEIEECITVSSDVEKIIDAKLLAYTIENFLDSLTQENQVIFLRRYWFSDNYEQISKRTGLTEKNISVRLTRMRKQLREYFRKEGFLR